MWPFKKKTQQTQTNENDPWLIKQKEYDIRTNENINGKGKHLYCVTHQFLFNNELKKMAFYATVNGNHTLIEKDFKDLIGCEYSKNNQVIGSASTGGAIVGGMLAGTAGAVIGATAGQKTFLSLDLKMFFNDFDLPILTIKYEINYKSVYNSEKNAGFPIVRKFEELYAMCQYIINQNKLDQN